MKKYIIGSFVWIVFVSSVCARDRLNISPINVTDELLVNPAPSCSGYGSFTFSPIEADVDATSVEAIDSTSIAAYPENDPFPTPLNIEEIDRHHAFLCAGVPGDVENFISALARCPEEGLFSWRHDESGRTILEQAIASGDIDYVVALIICGALPTRDMLVLCPPAPGGDPMRNFLVTLFDNVATVQDHEAYLSALRDNFNQHVEDCILLLA